jgi:hypothetical protein
MGLIDIALYVIGCHVTHDKRFRDASDDMANTVYSSLNSGGK